MTIIEIFKDIVSKIPADVDGNTFAAYYGETSWQNLISEDADFPLVTMDFINTVDFTITKTLFINETYPLNIYIGYDSLVDWTTEEHEVVIAKATTAARNIISQLQNYKDSNGNRLISLVEFTSSAIRTILRESDDVGTSGILLPLKVTPAIELSTCT